MSDRKGQVKFSWFDPVTGWTLKAKPDWVEYLSDDRGPIVRIIDEKTAGHTTTYQKRNLFFFGLVAAKQFDEEKDAAVKRGESYRLPSIELVVRLLGERDDPQEPRDVVLGFYSRKREWEKLAEVRRVIDGIKGAFEADLFPAKTGWNCDTCPHAHDCEAFQALQPAGQVIALPVLPSTA